MQRFTLNVQPPWDSVVWRLRLGSQPFGGYCRAPLGYLNTLGAVKRAVGTGLGIAVIPHLAAREEILRSELVEILKAYPKNAQTSDHIYAIWHDDVPEGLRDAFCKACDLESID